jgi:hypothetical protein
MYFFFGSVKSLFLLSCFICIFGISFPLAAQQKFVRGSAVDSNKEAATQKAKLSAWKNYLGMIQGAKLDNLLANEKMFVDQIDSFMTDVVIVEEKCEGGFFGKCSISLKASISENVIDSKLRQTTIRGSTQAAVKGGVSEDVAFLVMARVADSQISFDTKATKRSEISASTKSSTMSSDQSIGGSSAAASASQDETSDTRSSKAVSGGSQENKRDRIKYVAWGNVSDLQNRIGETLTNNRVSTVPWEDLVSNCGVNDSAPFSRHYADSESGQLPANIRNDIFRKLREECQISKIIIAQIEIDGYRTDPGTGLWLATGNVNIQVYDITGRFGRSIGAANRSFSGRAEKQLDASRNALANSASIASDVIVNQFNLR